MFVLARYWLSIALSVKAYFLTYEQSPSLSRAGLNDERVDFVNGIGDQRGHESLI